MPDKKVSIIVPIFNKKEYTLRFLNSIKKIKYSNLEVIIIDDGSTDGSADAIEKEYPEVIILKGDGDFWWTKSMNLGVKYALENGTDYVLTLNNDLIIDENIVNAHLECIKKYDKAVIGSKILDKNDTSTVINGAGKINLFFPPNINYTPEGKKDCEAYQIVKEAGAIAGMGTFLPISVFKEIGLYNDEWLPQYYADVEHQFRAKKAGYKLIFNPEAIIYNDIESTWTFPKRLTLQGIKDLLFHKRSGYLVKAHYYLYSNYWPKFTWFIPFTLLYLKCFAGVILSITKMKK